MHLTCFIARSVQHHFCKPFTRRLCNSRESEFMSQYFHTATPLDGANLNEEQAIANAIETVRNLQVTSANSQQDAVARLETARRIITNIDDTPFMTWPDRYDDQVFVISELQNFAYREADGGGIQDIAQWCVRHYLQILNRSSPENVDALSGLGQAWLFRAQCTLSRIHRLEGSSSSGASSARPPSSGGRLSFTSTDDARETARATAEADVRAGTADYVEARGMLLPATEYFQRAVAAAERSGRLNGELLSLAAEAHMSLGNVSYSHHNEHYFQQAVLYLQTASRITGFQMSPYLQSYLDDFGRLMQ